MVSKRNVSFFTSPMRLRVMDVSCFTEKNTITNVTPPSRLLKLSVRDYSLT